MTKRSLAYQILNDDEDASDAVGDAMLTICGIIGSIGDIDSPRTRSIIAIITKHRAIDIARKRRASRCVRLNEEELKDIPDDSIEAEDGDGALVRAVARLPEQYREIIFLIYDNRLSLKEAAEILDMSYVGVRKMNSRAKRALRRLIDEEIRRDDT